MELDTRPKATKVLVQTLTDGYLIEGDDALEAGLQVVQAQLEIVRDRLKFSAHNLELVDKAVEDDPQNVLTQALRDEILRMYGSALEDLEKVTVTPLFD